MNAVLRDSYTQDCERGLARWNRELEKRDVAARLYLPAPCFNRRVGVFADIPCDPSGKPISREEYEQKRGDWLVTEADRTRVGELLKPVYEPGKIAGWIAPPARGINNQPLDFEYVITK
jgi:benzoyl-CoA 2,3-dioxygenase component B